jgi:hypothetical protein
MKLTYVSILSSADGCLSHGVLHIIAWCAFLPVGGFIARLKPTAFDWFKVHKYNLLTTLLMSSEYFKLEVLFALWWLSSWPSS